MNAYFLDLWKACEGGEHGNGPTIGYFSRQSSATEAARGKGWWGGDGTVLGVPAVCVNGKFYILSRRDPVDVDLEQAKKDKELKERTLASLSSEQKRVLGLHD